MPARIIDGKSIAADLRTRVAAEVQRLKSQHGVEPGLAVVLVGENPASVSSLLVRQPPRLFRLPSSRSTATGGPCDLPCRLA